ncbi:MAG: tetratricopeptide repeat protein [Candidatus Lokiarchaeota archaeon]|nr:tetratricopeptide repeat protein [Candidatus Lokiarchaeota archaeon]
MYLLIFYYNKELMYGIQNNQINKQISVGRFSEVLHLINTIQKERKLSFDELLIEKYVRIFISLDEGNFVKGEEIANNMIKISKKNGHILGEIDGIIGKAENSICLGVLNKSRIIIQKGINLLSNNVQENKSKEFIKRKAYFKFLLGRIFAEKTKVHKAINLFQESYELRKKINYKYGMLWSLINSGSLLMSIGKFEKAKKNLGTSLSLAEEINCEVGIIWILITLGGIEYHLRNLDKAMSYAERGVIISEKYNYKHSSSLCYDIIGHCLNKKGYLNKALHYFQKSLTNRIETGYKYLLAQSYYTIGNIYIQKGELKEGLDYFNHILDIPWVKKDEISKPAYLTIIGRIYGELGDFLTAKKYLTEAIELLKTKEGYIFHYQNFNVSIAKTLHGLIVILIQSKEYNLVRYYLEELNKLRIKYPEMIQFKQLYRLDKALFLKTSVRLMDRMEAGTILKKISEEDIFDYEITTEAMINLCEVLISELELTGDERIFKEIDDLIEKLLEIAQSQSLFELLASTYFFKAKISLLKLEIDIAKKLFMKAQNIAHEQGLERLANQISNAHDAVLKNLNNEKKKEKNISLQERIANSRQDFLFSKLLGSKMDDVEKENMDKPIYVVILSSHDGRCIYSKSFQKISLNEDLISGFISAINMFGKEAFSSSGSIDRIRHGDYSIIFQTYDGLIFGYVFKGSSSGATYKLNNFIDKLLKEKAILRSIDLAVNSFIDISEEVHSQIDKLIYIDISN